MARRRGRTARSVPRLGKQPPRYRFFLNPYTDVRFTTCPQCGGKTRQRKLPLVIHVDPMQLIALNKTCRYCPGCDLLIAHQDELEAWLAAFFDEHQPEVVGNDYLVLGTEDRADWLRGMRTAVYPQEGLGWPTPPSSNDWSQCVSSTTISSKKAFAAITRWDADATRRARHLAAPASGG